MPKLSFAPISSGSNRMNYFNDAQAETEILSISFGERFLNFNKTKSKIVFTLFLSNLHLG